MQTRFGNVGETDPFGQNGLTGFSPSRRAHNRASRVFKMRWRRPGNRRPKDIMCRFEAVGWGAHDFSRGGP